MKENQSTVNLLTTDTQPSGKKSVRYNPYNAVFESAFQKKETITRKTLLYQTNVEYGSYCLNHVLGCSHGCLYPCYAMMMAKRFGKVRDYDDWIKPKIVGNTLELLKKELPKYRHKVRSVHLCFSTDPFMYGYDEIAELSLKLIKTINDEKIGVVFC